MAEVDPTKTTDAQKAADAQRQADAQRASAARPAADARKSAQDRNREQVAREREERANRPHGVGGNPTPTQQENDEIRSGVRHIDDKEDDGSGPDRYAGRNLRADQARGYETR